MILIIFFFGKYPNKIDGLKNKIFEQISLKRPLRCEVQIIGFAQKILVHIMNIQSETLYWDHYISKNLLYLTSIRHFHK